MMLQKREPENQLIEYQELSEDRRRAVEIFIKGFIIGVGIIAFGFKLLIDAKDIMSIIIIGGFGFVLGVQGIFYFFKCRRHNETINKRLNEIAKNLGFSYVIPTQYIFNSTFIGATIIGIAWLAMIIILILKSK